MNSSKLTPLALSVEEAMGLSIPEKLLYFRNVRVKHARVQRTLDDLQANIVPDSGTDIVLLVGPPGVGKSTLVASLKEQIIKENAEKMEVDSSLVPVAMIEAPSSGEQVFSWRMFYTRLGRALNEPLMDKKILDRQIDGRLLFSVATHGGTVAAKRDAIENVLQQRGTLVVIIDEAVHLLLGARGDRLQQYMDTLKSLANICGVTLVLVGSYDLFALLELSGQLARRTSIVHFQRYMADTQEDMGAFRKSLVALQRYLPIAGVPDLSVYAEGLQDACVGCVGNLKNVLTKALNLALRDGRWSAQCLDKALMSDVQVATILKEVLDGEQRIEGAIFGSSALSDRPDRRR